MFGLKEIPPDTTARLFSLGGECPNAEIKLLGMQNGMRTRERCYMVSTKVFEEPIYLLEEKQGKVHATACFRPSAGRLMDIANNGQKLLQNASDKDLSEFVE